MAAETNQKDDTESVVISKQDFMRFIHDIKGSLTVIQANAEILMLKPDLAPEKRDKFFKAIVKRSSQLNALFNEAMNSLREPESDGSRIFQTINRKQQEASCEEGQ